MKKVKNLLQKLSDKNTIMKIIQNKFNYTVVLLLCSLFSLAQLPPDPGGGTGGVGPGQRASSIDMYAFVLIAVAIIFAVFFAKNYIKKLAK